MSKRFRTKNEWLNDLFRGLLRQRLPEVKHLDICQYSQHCLVAVRLSLLGSREIVIEVQSSEKPDEFRITVISYSFLTAQPLKATGKKLLSTVLWLIGRLKEKHEKKEAKRLRRLQLSDNVSA